MPFITHRLQAYFLKITSGRWPLFTSVHCFKRVWKLPYARLCRSSSIAATSSTMACLSSWIVMIREHTTSFFKFLHSNQYGIPRRYATMSTNIELSSKDTLHFCHRLRFVITTNTGNTLHVPTLHCNWPYEMVSSPLPFPFPPATTSYCTGTIFKFEMCQSAPRHPVLLVHTKFWPEHPKRQNSWECLFTDMWMILKHLTDIRYMNTDWMELACDSWM